MPDNKDFNEEMIAKAVKKLAKSKPVFDLADSADIIVQGIGDNERLIEALLFASSTPLNAQEIAVSLGENCDIGACLARLKRHYMGRGINLVEVSGGWRFQTAPDLSFVFNDKREEPKKLGRAALETLSIIAYHQPCTRAEIEEIRGVSLGRGTLDFLIDIKWVRPARRRKSPGKPLTYRTTKEFLEHFCLVSLEDLPGKAELQSQGLLSANLPKDFEIPTPQDLIYDDEEFEAAVDIDESEFIEDFFDEK